MDEPSVLIFVRDVYILSRRAGFPGKKNFPFLKTLNLRTILYLCPEDYPEANLSFLTGIHVQLLQYGVAGNKVRSAEAHDARWVEAVRF